MGKGYQIVEPRLLDPLFIEDKYEEYSIAIFYWLIEELYKELGDDLIDVEIDVIPVKYLSSRGYPALGLHYEREFKTDAKAKINNLVETTAERLLRERPISELIRFIAKTNLDWKAVTAKIMETKDR